MASRNVMSHTVGGNLTSQLNAYGVQWFRYGENIGWSTASWPSTSAKAIFNAWMNSAPHRAMILSNRFNYVGVGLAYRSSGHKTFGSAVFAETTDHTRAVARVTRATRSGNDVRWSWSGYDPRLQTHTAGLRNYDVQYRTNYGAWHLLRNDTSAELGHHLQQGDRDIRRPRASHRPAWQCGRMEQRGSHPGSLTRP